MHFHTHIAYMHIVNDVHMNMNMNMTSEHDLCMQSCIFYTVPSGPRASAWYVRR
jgi:hypothetical protein